MAAVADTNPPEGGFVDGKENDDANGKTTQTLAEMFEQGQGEIGTARNCNLFQELQGRNLTDKEQKIVQARTAHMKKVLSIPPKLPVICQPSAAPRARPAAVTMKAHLK